MLAIGLALASSVVYGVSDFLGGSKSRSLPLLYVLLVSQASALVLLAAIVIADGEGPPADRSSSTRSSPGWARRWASPPSTAGSPSA